MHRYFRWLVVALTLVLSTPVWSGEVVRMRVEDTIQPASQQFIERVLAEAVERDAALVVMELDTPGGLVDTTRDITTAITTSSATRSPTMRRRWCGRLPNSGAVIRRPPSAR
jgi:membrane-bound serine protease (ClpP class)